MIIETRIRLKGVGKGGFGNSLKVQQAEKKQKKILMIVETYKESD